MFTEIEAKLKVDLLQDVESRLKQLGAEFVAEQLQSDIHFDEAEAALKNADSCLRLRRQVVGGTTRFFMTYKGAKDKSTQDIEIEVIGSDSITRLLLTLGNQKALFKKVSNRSQT